jgi:hypothetical protein
MVLGHQWWRRHFKRVFVPQARSLIETLETRLLPTFANVRGDVGSKTTIASGDPNGSAGSRWPARAEATHSSTPLRRLSLNPLGNLLRFGYHSATGTSAWATA